MFHPSSILVYEVWVTSVYSKAVEMTQSIKCLHLKYEDLNSSPWLARKRWGPEIPTLQMRRQMNSSILVSPFQSESTEIDPKREKPDSTVPGNKRNFWLSRAFRGMMHTMWHSLCARSHKTLHTVECCHRSEHQAELDLVTATKGRETTQLWELWGHTAALFGVGLERQTVGGCDLIWGIESRS